MNNICSTLPPHQVVNSALCKSSFDLIFFFSLVELSSWLQTTLWMQFYGIVKRLHIEGSWAQLCREAVEYVNRQNNVHGTKCPRRIKCPAKRRRIIRKWNSRALEIRGEKELQKRKRQEVTERETLSSKAPVLAVAVVIRCFRVARAGTGWLFRRKDRLDAQTLLCFWRVALQSISRTRVRDGSQIRRRERSRGGPLAVSFPGSRNR